MSALNLCNFSEDDLTSLCNYLDTFLKGNVLWVSDTALQDLKTAFRMKSSVGQLLQVSLLTRDWDGRIRLDEWIKQLALKGHKKFFQNLVEYSAANPFPRETFDVNQID